MLLWHTFSDARCHAGSFVCLVALVMGLGSGCSGRSIQADNPVLAATPPRARLGQSPARTVQSNETTAGDIAQASFSDKAAIPSQAANDVAATVNGIPILTSDVIERFTPQLKQAEAQLPAAEYEKLKRQLIERELPQHIEQAILVDSALSQLPAEQKKAVDEQLEKIFAQELTRIQTEMDAGSLAELEAILQQAGTSITNLQRSFNNRQLAGQAMGLLTPPEPTVSRVELLKEYKKRTAEFTSPEMVKWQQIWISYNKYGGKEQAFEALDAVVQALKNGQPFDDVARQHSDGVMAADGGVWDWTERGSLANEEIERMLFELPVGEIGQVVAGDSAFQIVRVVEHKPVTTKSFADVQGQLAKEIKQKKQQKLLDDVVAKLKKDAVITTMFDDEDSNEQDSDK